MNIRLHDTRRAALPSPSSGLPPATARSGIALVITLIMLAVTLVMAVTFLAISSRERGSVTTSTDANHARQAADAALANAQAQIVASILASTNPYNFGMFVSTNYQNPNGFLTSAGVGIVSPTNVSYYYGNGAFLNAADLLVNIGNLQYLPRAPVFVPTNGNQGYDFRFFLDLNRNGQFENSGIVPNTIFSNNAYVTNGYIGKLGDPQWIGVLEHPDAPHGPANRFIARYSFIAIPVGNTLDVNAIYNAATFNSNSTPSITLSPGYDSYIRNQGVGSWELNLAAFLADLNTNEWDPPIARYSYNTPYNLSPFGVANLANSGFAFEDALGILRYRYNDTVYSQPLLSQLYNNSPIFQVNNLDVYSQGALVTNTGIQYPNGFTNRPWSGADTTNHFFSLDDYFNPNIFRPAGYGILPTTKVFTDRLLHAGTNSFPSGNPNQVPTYNRYTFYDLIQQLGSDSEPQIGKLNINFNNVDYLGDVQPYQGAVLQPWTNALAFFTNAADRLLRTYTTNWASQNLVSNGAVYYSYYFTNTFGTNMAPFGINHIPVWVGGRFVYTPSVQRLLQLAANIYDATQTNPYPSVFRPTFYRDPVTANIYIIGYQAITNIYNGINDTQLSQPLDISMLVAGTLPATGTGSTRALNNVNVYGVPWILGAKKGLPSFNSLYTLNIAQVSRLLQVNRTSANTVDPANYTTNEMFVMSISNTVGMALWNSYNSNYYGSGNLEIYLQDNMRVGLSNAYYSGFFITNFNYYAHLGGWQGSGWTYAPASTRAPIPSSFFTTNWTLPFLAPSAYQSQSGLFINLSNNPPWETSVINNYDFPKFQLLTTNWSQAFVLDGLPGHEHVVDYVQFSGPNNTRDLAAELADPNYNGPPQFAYQWSTNGSGKLSRAALPTAGEVNQLLVSRGKLTAPPNGVWSTTQVIPGDASVLAQQAFFDGFWQSSFQYNHLTYYNRQLSVQAPYTPTRTMYDYTLWQANDPLVHYLASDLTYNGPAGTTGVQKTDNGNLPTLTGLNLSALGDRYQPWGLAGQMAKLANVDTNANNLEYKDPLVWGSDYWDFPTNLFPSIGWLGRVHRGTPWQTIYLKSPDLLGRSATNGYKVTAVGGNTWTAWTGNNNYFDATNTAPVNDRLLFDLFVTGPNQNATLGQLSINQPYLPAWSAVFSGVPVFTNQTGPNTIVDHAGAAGTNSYLGYLWNSIQQSRASLPGGVFKHLGDLLATPALTAQSPYLSVYPPAQAPTRINEQMYEWLPQQILSLVKVGTPRYVVYCYGQALKPAPNGIVPSGPYALMCTNYAIVSETAVRAVMEIPGSLGSAPKVTVKNLNLLPPN